MMGICIGMMVVLKELHYFKMGVKMEKIIKLYIDKLAQANHDKILLEAENEDLKNKIKEQENQIEVLKNSQNNQDEEK